MAIWEQDSDKPYVTFVLAECRDDYHRIGAFTGSRAKRRDLTHANKRNSLGVAIEAAAEGLNHIISRILAEHSDVYGGAADGSARGEEQFVNDNKSSAQFLQSIRRSRLHTFV